MLENTQCFILEEFAFRQLYYLKCLLLDKFDHCSCSQKRRSAQVLAKAREDHSIPLLSYGGSNFNFESVDEINHVTIQIQAIGSGNVSGLKFESLTRTESRTCSQMCRKVAKIMLYKVILTFSTYWAKIVQCDPIGYAVLIEHEVLWNNC